MFDGDFADTCFDKFALKSIGAELPCQACAGTGSEELNQLEWKFHVFGRKLLVFQFYNQKLNNCTPGHLLPYFL